MGGKHGLSASAGKRVSSASSSSYASTCGCTVTPPMSLPSRGWGDSGSEGCGSRYSFSAFSVYSTAADNSVVDDGSSASCCGGCNSSVGGGNSINNGSSGHGSVCSGGSSSSVGSLGDEDRKQRQQHQQQQLKPFYVSEGFSSAEEETWGSEGEVRIPQTTGVAWLSGFVVVFEVLSCLGPGALPHRLLLPASPTGCVCCPPTIGLLFRGALVFFLRPVLLEKVWKCTRDLLTTCYSTPARPYAPFL